MYRFKDFKNLVFSRRSFILVILKCVVMFGLVVRLFFLQVLNAKGYRTLSEKNRIKFFLLEPKRGFIKDSQGVVLAENKVNYQLYFYKQHNREYEVVLEKVLNILSINQNDRINIAKLVKNASYLYPVMIQDNLSWSQVTKIESGGNNLEGAYINKGYIRFYPMKRLFSHTIGYVGIPTTEEIAEYRLHQASGFRVGKIGIEKVFNRELIGEFGLKKVEVNAYRTVVRELEQESSVRGKDVSISIDSRLQEYVYNSLNENGSSAVVMDIKTGNILSMVSRPSFDPNIFSMPISHEDWGGIVKNKKHPLTNRAIAQLYPPGSSWKIVTSLAVLRAGLDPEKTVYCPGFTTVGTQVFKCWKEGGHGHVDFKSALHHSCNVYFYTMGMASGIDNIHHVAAALGFGSKTGIQLPGEIAGTNPSRPWKEKAYDSKWLVGDTANAAIGQGYNLVTPIQLATMISKIAGGRKIKPSLYLDNVDSVESSTLHIPQDHLQMVRTNLEGVFNNPRGAGYNLRIKETEFMLAGKTGTSQVISGDTVHSTNRSVKSHSVFIGYAPIHDPKYAISVIAENAGWGMGTAAPAGVNILYFAQTKL